MDDPNTIHVVLYTPSMEIIQQHMENDAELIAQAGGDPSPEANEMVICSDWTHTIVFAEIKSKEWPNIGSILLNLKKKQPAGIP